ncbi:MAG: glutathione peroxidase, partial [Burkholderiaceae bacterium]
MTRPHNPRRFLLLAAPVLLASTLGLANSKAQASSTSASCPSLLNQTFPRLQDDEPRSLCEFKGK